jgi:hypothetical protein
VPGLLNALISVSPLFMYEYSYLFLLLVLVPCVHLPNDPTLLYQWSEDVPIDPITWWRHYSGLVQHTHSLFFSFLISLVSLLCSVSLLSLYGVCLHFGSRLASQSEDTMHVSPANGRI